MTGKAPVERVGDGDAGLLQTGIPGRACASAYVEKDDMYATWLIMALLCPLHKGAHKAPALGLARTADKAEYLFTRCPCR